MSKYYTCIYGGDMRGVEVSDIIKLPKDIDIYKYIATKFFDYLDKCASEEELETEDFVITSFFETILEALEYAYDIGFIEIDNRKMKSICKNYLKKLKKHDVTISSIAKMLKDGRAGNMSCLTFREVKVTSLK